MTSTPTLDELGTRFLVRAENSDTSDLHATLLRNWTEGAAERAATFDRTAGRKAAFHTARLDELTAGGNERTIAAARQKQEHWRAHEGRGAELVERLVTGLRLLPETPISQVASWAVWDEHAPGDGHWYERRDRLEALTSGTVVPPTGAVFLGLNAGEYAASQDRSDAWSMFHGSTVGGVGSGTHGNIRNLADHIVDTPLWGSYLTDFYKNIPSVDEQVLKALLDTASTPDIRMLNTLMALIIRDELACFGLDVSTTHAVALGGRVGNLARKTMRDWRSVIDVPHYAAYVKTEKFRAATDNALRHTHPYFQRDADPQG